MKRTILAACAAVLAATVAQAGDYYRGGDPDAAPYQAEPYRAYDGYDLGSYYYPERVPHPPSTQFGPFGRGSYAQPSYRTPDTTTVQTDDGGRATYTVLPPPPAYGRPECVPRDVVEGRRHRRLPRTYTTLRSYRYRIVNGYAQVIPPPCGRVVGILTPAH